MSIIDDRPRARSYEIDGNSLPLDRILVDVTGGRWEWTGLHDGAGVPLMQFVQHPTDQGVMSVSERRPVPLDEVQRCHGPLIPEPGPLLAEDYRRALRAPSPLDLYGGAA